MSKCWVVWDKKGNMDFQNPFSDVELAWTNFTSVSKKFTCIQQGFVSDDKSERIHPTQKPLPLFQWCLENYSKEGDLVLDCFSGSGTTAVACHNLNRRFICIEKDPEYHAASVERLKREQAQMRLF
jgi:site-specific DNA-methyltransferase (adenine-specific)